MCFIPLPKRSSIDLNNGRFGEGVCADELVVGGMVRDNDNTDFARYTFGAPGEVTRVQTESAIFLVAAASADEMDAFSADTSICWLATFLEGSRYC